MNADIIFLKRSFLKFAFNRNLKIMRITNFSSKKNCTKIKTSEILEMECEFFTILYFPIKENFFITNKNSSTLTGSTYDGK